MPLVLGERLTRTVTVLANANTKRRMCKAYVINGRV
jgi:hypothetical protein